jgi:malate/lactate dehydrogenase
VDRVVPIKMNEEEQKEFSKAADELRASLKRIAG